MGPGSKIIAKIIAMAGFAACAAMPAMAANPQQGDWTAQNFTFHGGETMALKLHYTTLGDAKNPAVLVMHGTNGTGSAMVAGAFGDALFGPGEPLDASKYFIILPDSIGAGGSSKPSDGLKMKFPRYNYDDIVSAQYRLLTEGLGIRHLRLVTGNSMGGMLTWMWGEIHPDFMDALVPLASTPAAMSARNWMLRRMVIESIKADPAWNNGNYAVQPPAFKTSNVFFGIATSGGTLAYQKQAPTREAADRIVDGRLAAAGGGDANDAIYQLDSSRDYDPWPGLSRIHAPLLAVNSGDDERNPVETGLLDKAIAQIKGARAYIIPASADTSGHGTTGQSKFWAAQLGRFMAGLHS